MHVRCVSEACPSSALLCIFLMTWMREKRTCLLNLHGNYMLGGTFDSSEYKTRIQNDRFSLDTPPAVLGCCKSEEKATPIPSCVSGSDVCSACEESPFLKSTGQTSPEGAQLDAALWKKSAPTGGE